MIRVFVGCSNGEDTESQAVLEYTLRAHASRPLEITWMSVRADPAHPLGGWNTAGWATPFSGLRWAPPALCGFEGKAIYLDSDMILRGDIAELWDQDIPPGRVALVSGRGDKIRTCVMVMDCAAAGRWLPPLAVLKQKADGRRFTEALAADRKAHAPIDGLWNCVDLKLSGGIDDPAVKLIHYSSIAHQPHLRHARARLARQGSSHWYDGEVFDHWRPELVSLFDRLLAEATAAGYPPERYEPSVRYRPAGLKSYRDVRVKGFSA